MALLFALVSCSNGAAQQTIWPSSTVSAAIDNGASGPLELGVSFKSDVSGSITGIRFYKSSANTGTHVGRLWSPTGALLASVTFTGETASGWQQANFSTPVALYGLTVGHFSANWVNHAAYILHHLETRLPAHRGSQANAQFLSIAQQRTCPNSDPLTSCLQANQELSISTSSNDSYGTLSAQFPFLTLNEPSIRASRTGGQNHA